MNQSETHCSETHFEPTTGGPAPLRALARRPPLVVTPDTSLRATLYALSQHDTDAAVVADANSQLPLGLVTLRDALHHISFEGGDLDAPVATQMLGAPSSLAADASSHRARVTMAKRGINHLVLTEADGRLCGLITQADLLSPHASVTQGLIDSINAARDIEAMTIAADQVRRRGAELFQAGMAVDALCQWMSGLNDLIGMRVIELIEDDMDLPPVPWCWMIFGSEGRLEQTFSTDQDNGLLFVPSNTRETQDLREAFLPFACAVNQALHHCGFERCSGDIMAGNPQWCLSAAEWQQRFSNWLRVPEPEAVMHSAIFFDFRPLYGANEPLDQLRAWLIEQAPGQGRFLRALAEHSLAVSPPLGWAGQFTFDRNRDFPHTLDLKIQGARYFVDAARLWALKDGLWATGTTERLQAAGQHRRVRPEEIAAEVEAFHLIQRFRIQQQLQTQDKDAVNRVDPSDLNELHRLMLKESFKQARKIQTRLRQEMGL